MKILAVGGGSGGHVTPVVAVLSEVHEKKPQAEIRFWCDKVFEKQARQIMSGSSIADIRVDIVTAGKLRRYQHLTLVQHLLIPSILFANIADIFKVMIGVGQSLIKLIAWRPDVIFVKGGYVSLPVGWAANLLRIPTVIHDSDAHPGLTNRLLAKRANFITTGVPLEYYSYPAAKSKYVGIPISRSFQPLEVGERRRVKVGLGFAEDRPLIVVTGGGLGAKRINDAIMANRNLLIKYGDVLLISGVGQYSELREIASDSQHFKLKAFINEGMSDIIGAADVVVARAGATTILELAAVGVPTILVPNARLTGGHQVKNAAVYSDAEAALIVDEEKFNHNPDELVGSIKSLLAKPSLARKLASNIRTFARPNAARDVADILLKIANK